MDSPLDAAVDREFNTWLANQPASSIRNIVGEDQNLTSSFSPQMKPRTRHKMRTSAVNAVENFSSSTSSYCTRELAQGSDLHHRRTASQVSLDGRLAFPETFETLGLLARESSLRMHISRLRQSRRSVPGRWPVTKMMA